MISQEIRDSLYLDDKDKIVFIAETRGHKYKLYGIDKGNYYSYQGTVNNSSSETGTGYNKEELIKELNNKIYYSSKMDNRNYKIIYNDLDERIGKG